MQFQFAEQAEKELNDKGTEPIAHTVPAASVSHRLQSRGYRKSEGTGYLVYQRSYFILFTLLADSKLFREQRAQNLHDHPQHHGANQNENEQEHQHNGGVDKEFNHSNTSHQIFQIVEQEAASSIRKAADNAPFEMVEMFHGHILFPFQLVPEPAQLTKQIVVNLKVHIQYYGLF